MPSRLGTILVPGLCKIMTLELSHLHRPVWQWLSKDKRFTLLCEKRHIYSGHLLSECFWWPVPSYNCC